MRRTCQLAQSARLSAVFLHCLRQVAFAAKIRVVVSDVAERFLILALLLGWRPGLRGTAATAGVRRAISDRLRGHREGVRRAVVVN